MCGIAGIIGKQEAGWLKELNASMAHRGPDDAGFFQEGLISLAQRRLSVIDLKGGHQPMQSPDGRYVLIYNGEIYNSSELRESLEINGVVFTTDHSDTEVLLHLLVREGEEALSKLNGMFSFAFFDRQSGSLFCARDRFGIKPFFYFHKEGLFAFASELKALLTLPMVKREPNLNSLFHFFSLQYVPGEETSFVDVMRLTPGSWLRYSLNDKILTKGYWWTPTFSSQGYLSKNNLTEQISELISDAVDRWSVSDVPMGCLLSGGLDSSVIVSLLAEKGHSLKTYTVGFSGQGELAWDELQLARKVAEKWGTEHHEIILKPESLLDDLIDMIWALDEPYGGGLPSWSVFKEMSTDVKVAMTGTGGDELFGNYNKYIPMEGRFRSRIPGLARRCVNKTLFEHEYFKHYCYADDAEKRSLLLTDKFVNSQNTLDFMWSNFNSGPSNETLRDRVVRVDLVTQLPEEFLMMTDRFSMAHSIEARTPFLDHELAEQVYAINASIRLNPREYKPLLRGVAKNILPPEFMIAPKKGFVIPLKLWLKGQLRPLLERVLNPERLKEQGLVQADFFARYAIPHIQGKEDNTNRLWTMLMFQLWWDLFVLERPRDELAAEVRGTL